MQIMRWQPIKDAPKDGSHIILCSSVINSKTLDVRTGFWSGMGGKWHIATGLIPILWMEKPEPPGSEQTIKLTDDHEDIVHKAIYNLILIQNETFEPTKRPQSNAYLQLTKSIKMLHLYGSTRGWWEPIKK